MTPSESLAKLWATSDSQPDIFEFVEEVAVYRPEELLPLIRVDQQNRWKTNAPLSVEVYLTRLPRLAENPAFKLELAVSEFEARREAGLTSSIEEFASRFSDISDALRSQLSVIESSDRETTDRGEAAQDNRSLATLVFDPELGGGQLGRYRLLRVLGEGAFGRVYLGFDEELQRQVAIKVPTEEHFEKLEDAEQYLAEARTVANLDHPHIVPVYDMGRTADGLVYVVSKYIEGCTLEERIQTNRPDPATAANWLSSIASALHHAHRRRLIHRDVKPSNILLEGDETTPYITDFGLAIREEDYLRDMRVAGTPAYMSPEQARGEGHRLDGRSDVFSLGVVLYELLTGTRPFRGETHSELGVQITKLTPRPPRLLEDTIPAELERVCLRALAKRVADRHRTAAEFAEELQSWNAPTTSTPPRALTIVPRGLRSFEHEDAEFFLDLLPGPRNRQGLPMSIDFWKTRIEETDPDETFLVGLIYGPSGCGKSSLVKAGLLPQLSKGIRSVYIEATPDDTERRLLRGLRKSLADLPGDLGLVETFAFLRRANGAKVVVVIDQFEQWLHEHRSKRDTQLVAALRQCDGRHLQAIVMVRDDFAMAAARFMDALDVPILQGQNFNTVDLFDVEHAGKVLLKFGQAFGRLSSPVDALDANEDAFVERVVQGLAVDGKVISVQIAILAEMLKGKAWTLETLKRIGGVDRIGVSFLEETLEARSANPKYQQHQLAIRQVLQRLLPEHGSEIKGHMRTQSELMLAAGYVDRANEFRDVLRILDGELRLITPTDPSGGNAPGDAVEDSASKQCYQLTHDYLVPALREWLTRKQQATRRGRAELKLEERAKLWASKPESRYLPSLSEWLRILTLTNKPRWTAPQSRMMRRAGRVHGMRLTLAVTAIFVAALGALATRGRIEEQQEATRVEGLVGRLMSATPSELPKIVTELEANPAVAKNYLAPYLRGTASTTDERRELLHARLASVRRDPQLIDPLVDELLTGNVRYVLPIRQVLGPFAESLAEPLREIYRTDASPQRRFRAALALAAFLPESSSDFWTADDLRFLAVQLVSYNAEYQPVLREALQPIRDQLLDTLEVMFGDTEMTDAQRLGVANAFADYAAEDVERLTYLLPVSTAEQFSVIYPLVAANPSSSAANKLADTVATLPPDDLGSVDRIVFGQKRALSAVTLLRLGERQRVLPVFEYTDDPEASTQFIFSCRARGVKTESLLELLDVVIRGKSGAPEVDLASEVFQRGARTRYSLLLTLGEFRLEEIPDERRARLLEQLAEWYANDPSSAVHGATGWLLRQWGQTDVVTRIDQTAVPYSPNREWFTLAIQAPSVKYELPPANQTGVRSLKQIEDGTGTALEEKPVEKQTSDVFYYTFIVFQGQRYQLGTAEEGSAGRADEKLRWRTVDRPFAVLDREVTMEELLAFKQDVFQRALSAFPASEAVAGYGVDWFHAADFCRWLTNARRLGENEQAFADPDGLIAKGYQINQGSDYPTKWPLRLDRAGFRLLTEDEWEVMARGGSRMAYAFGGDVRWLDRFDWYQVNADDHRRASKLLRPNGRGIFDVHGNRLEWVYDWYDREPDLENGPLGPASGADRSQRGGAFYSPADSCRSARRGGKPPQDMRTGFGLRICLTLMPDVSAEEN